MELVIVMNKLVLDLAIRAHEGQKRKFSDLPYIVHPIEVATEVGLMYQARGYAREYTLQQINIALLHDVVEDCPQITEQEIINIAGKDVLYYVKELTNPSKYSPQLNRADRKAMDREHLAHVSYPSKIIKLIDRTCNLGDISGAKDGFKRLYCQESRLLLQVLSGTDAYLELQLEKAIERVEMESV